VFAAAMDVGAMELLPKIQDKQKPLFAVLSQLAPGKMRILMPPEEILIAHSRPLLLQSEAEQSNTDE
jgi:hypothetical protein